LYLSDDAFSSAGVLLGLTTGEIARAMAADFAGRTDLPECRLFAEKGILLIKYEYAASQDWKTVPALLNY
jgi:hypothetical protein